MNKLGWLAIVAVVVLCGPAFCEDAPRKSGEPEALINKLTEVSELGYGYSAMFSGSQFLPQADADEVHTLVLGSQRPTKSSTLEAIVRQGIIAVPSLLKHLDDDRKTQIQPVKGMMWMSFADEYDFNRRVRKQSPEGVNLQTLGQKPSPHQITVGDLCYVALGQILNRSFNATRYQPTGGVVVSSPTESKRLCAVVREDWQGLTEEKHRQSLIQDFLTPDSEDRRIGAYRRLALYYPQSVEGLVLKQLSEPKWAVTEKTRFIEALVHDDSKRIGDAVKQAFLQTPQDDYFSPACLRCLASRGYASFLVAQLEAIEPDAVEPDRLHLEYLRAISTSKERAVREKMLDILKRARNADYFMAALGGVEPPEGDMVLVLAKKLLDGLPEDTKQGLNMLQMIGQRYPGSAVRIYQDFLKSGSARRAETMCRVLWYGNPLSKQILAPLLDDKRELKGFSIPMRVCDRAATAISQTTDRIRFDSEWTVTQKDEAIIKLKQYCKESMQSNAGDSGPAAPK